ncbi:sigma-70 family RNA polymerase sigma factor [Paenibacillus rhizovicinus]|uniref:RNA polymerase sigma factor n=1 Tax=Paenibacillus rhizovicinus TaxID=2704463 RepID=A0A6C0PA86_9BACL|nr:sigma-70 family RNA polymerase sigma factor [Paenibacillus rhizovicinus]
MEDVYRMHMNDIYRYLHRLTGDIGAAEDLTQDTFIRAFRYLDVKKDGVVRPWLFKVAYHAFIDWYRKRKRVGLTVLRDAYAETSEERQDPEDHVLHKELWETFEQVISQFPWKQRHALLMFYAHQLSYEEIAEVLDISLADVKSAIYRGRQKLRVNWRSEDHEQ